MMRELSQPRTDDHPVAVAINDAAVRLRLTNAARAFLANSSAGMSATQRAEEAGAIVQEAHARAWKQRDQFDASRDVVTWLTGYVFNVTREYVKQRARDADRQAGDGARLAALAVDPARPVDEAVTEKLLTRDLLERLPPTDRQLLELKYWDEMTCGEIGRRLGMEENAVRTRQHRAIQKLRHACGVNGGAQP